MFPGSLPVFYPVFLCCWFSSPLLCACVAVVASAPRFIWINLGVIWRLRCVASLCRSQCVLPPPFVLPGCFGHAACLCPGCLRFALDSPRRVYRGLTPVVDWFRVPSRSALSRLGTDGTAERKQSSKQQKIIGVFGINQANEDLPRKIKVLVSMCSRA